LNLKIKEALVGTNGKYNQYEIKYRQQHQHRFATYSLNDDRNYLPIIKPFITKPSWPKYFNKSQ